MTRLFHTADVHLDTQTPERLAAFETILDAAEQQDARAVTVGGDLFEDQRAAEELRSDIRDVCADRDITIVAIPGNHDAGAFRGNRYYGEAFQAVTAKPYEHLEVEDLRITAVPFTQELTEDLLVDLRRRDAHTGPEALLMHCSLEAPVDTTAGEEATPRYCPVGTEALASLDFDYILAGHYHSSHLRDLPDGTTFVYPGTPASVTQAETGPRTVAILDEVTTPAIRLSDLDTFHYDKRRVRVHPGAENETLQEIEELVRAWENRDVSAHLIVDGLISWSEDDFAEAVSSLTEDVRTDNRTRSAQAVLSHPLYEQFRIRLDHRDELNTVPDTREYEIEPFHESIEEAVLAVMTDLEAEGVLR